MHRFILATVLFVCLSSVHASVTINLAASKLKQADGNPMPTNGMVILVASTTNSTFDGPTASSFVSGDDVEVARWDLSSTETPGDINTDVLASLSGNWTGGDPLAIYWYPTLTTDATMPGGGTTYGYYRDPAAISTSGSDSSDAWFTPADGGTITLVFLTTDAGGTTNPPSAGNASLVINTPPIALNDSFSRAADSSLKISIADMLANDSDPDANPISLLSVDASSTNGVSLTYDASKVYYNAPTGAVYNVTDRFSYSISDGLGGQATAFVTINISTNPTTPSYNITITTTNGGIPTINFAGIPNYTYWVQAATNMTPPIDWVTVSTNTADPQGKFSFTDTDFASYPMRFYRSAVP